MDINKVSFCLHGRGQAIFIIYQIAIDRIFNYAYRCADSGFIFRIKVMPQPSASDAQSQVSMPEALLAAVQIGDVVNVKKLLEQGADPNTKDKKGTPLLILTFGHSGRQAMMKLLIDHGADINGKDAIGCTALMYAAKGFPLIIKELLDQGANINISNNSGFTALQWAARWNHKSCVNLLIENGANVFHKNNAGKTAQNLAEEWGRESVAQMLQEWIPVQTQRATTAKHDLLREMVEKRKKLKIRM